MSKVLHIDLDAFFASVEIAEDPSLRGKEVVVMGAGKRGVVTSANYGARKYGIKAGMPYKKAFSLCPSCIFVPAKYELYEEYSRKFFKILEEFSPDVEHYSIDEAFIDISRLKFLWNSDLKLASMIKERIKSSISLESSVGIGDKKVSAKVATELAKPGGICKITDENEFLKGVIISKIPGIGRRLSVKFSMLGFERGEDIERKDFLLWEKIKTGFGLYVLPFERNQLSSLPFQSVSRGQTFDKDICDKEEILSYISHFCGEISETLVKNRVKASVLGIKLRYYNFYEEFYKTKVFPPVSNYSDIFKTAKSLFLKNYNPIRGKLRAVTVFGENVKRMPYSYLFDSKLNKRESLSPIIIKIKEKFGENKIFTAKKLAQNRFF